MSTAAQRRRRTRWTNRLVTFGWAWLLSLALWGVIAIVVRLVF